MLYFIPFIYWSILLPTTPRRRKLLFGSILLMSAPFKHHNLLLYHWKCGANHTFAIILEWKCANLKLFPIEWYWTRFPIHHKANSVYGQIELRQCSNEHWVHWLRFAFEWHPKFDDLSFLQYFHGLKSILWQGKEQFYSIPFPCIDCWYIPCNQCHARCPFDFPYNNNKSNCVGQSVNHVSVHSKTHARNPSFQYFRGEYEDTYQTKCVSKDEIGSSDQRVPYLQLISTIFWIDYFFTISKLTDSIREPFLFRKCMAVCMTCVSSTAFIKSSSSRNLSGVIFSLRDTSIS